MENWEITRRIGEDAGGLECKKWEATKARRDACRSGQNDDKVDEMGEGETDNGEGKERRRG